MAYVHLIYTAVAANYSNFIYMKYLFWISFFFFSAYAQAGNDFTDTTRTYAFPHLSTTPRGTVGMSWTETDNDGVNYFYWAESKDQGVSFGGKNLIHKANGIANSRLMRAKVLYKKDGAMVAIFGLRPAAAPVQPAAADHSHHHGTGGEKKPAEKSKRPTDLQIHYAVSKDNGMSWSSPLPVHRDLAPNVIRGFYDATVLANDEIAVAFLKDTGKPHERDLRLTTTVNGIFGEEKVIDPFVCDCCNVSLLVDGQGKLNVYYRANIQNIRDMAVMTSSDNGKTFSKSKSILDDKWEIKGCPHSGPVSLGLAGNNIIGWFSGTANAPGVRIATQQGKKLMTLEASAANPWLAGDKNSAWVLYENKVQESDSQPVTNIVYKKLSTGLNSASETTSILGQGANFTGVASGKSLIVAYETKGENQKSSLKVTRVGI